MHLEMQVALFFDRKNAVKDKVDIEAQIILHNDGIDASEKGHRGEIWGKPKLSHRGSREKGNPFHTAFFTTCHLLAKRK